jgi:hypothetical protein
MAMPGTSMATAYWEYLIYADDAGDILLVFIYDVYYYLT